MPVRNLSRSLGAPSKLTQSFGQNSQPLAGVRSGTQGINYALQELLAGLGIGEDRRNKAEFDAAIQKAMIEDPATITTQEEYAGSGVDGAMYDAPAQKEETSANPNRRSLKDRLSAAFEDIPNNPNVGVLNQSMIPGRLAADLATTRYAQTRADKKEDRAADFENKKLLKKMPGYVSGRPSAPIQNHNHREALVKTHGEGSPQVRQFDNYVRATQYGDLGDRLIAQNPQNPSSPIPVAPKGIPPEQTPWHKGRVARATAVGKAEGAEHGDIKARIAAAEAAMPRLKSTVEELKELAKTATHTMAGRAINTATRELGLDPGEGAASRAKYIAVVKNNVLPLLRQTFGAAFTAAEGDSLLATLGDPDMHPTEKNAVLDAFIEGKKAELRVLGRQLEGGVAPSKFTPRPGFTAVRGK